MKLSGGATHVIKIRSDMHVSNMDRLVELLLIELERRGNQVFFLDWVLHKRGYFMDFVQFDSIENLIQLWSIPYVARALSRQAPEIILTKNFVKSFAPSVPDGVAFKRARFILPLLYNNDLQIYWSKYSISTNDWRGNPIFVCASSF